MEQTARPPLRFELVGPFAVIQSGIPLSAREIGSRKGRTLLKLLLVERGRLVPAERIAEVAWGDSPPPRWERDVATLVSRLRAVFGADAIAGGPSGYRFVAGDRTEIDLDHAERLALESEDRLAKGEPALALAAGEQAVAILERGAVLEDEPYAEWADEARATSGRLLRRARGLAWTAAGDLGDHALAGRHAEAAIGANPLDEEAYRILMVAHRDGGNTAQALAVYERLREVLSEQLGADPSPGSRQLHTAILLEEPVAIRETSSAEGAPDPARDPTFVGRGPELQTLSRQLAAASRRQGRLVMLVGEAGIGKTRLALELVRMAESTGALVMQARCFQAERSLFLQPLADAIRSLVVRTHPEVVRDLVGEWAGPLGDLVPEIAQILRPLDYRPGAPDIERRRIFEAVASLLGSLSADRPTLLFLDDLHDAGASTIELLHFLRRRLADARVLVVGTVRVEEGAEALAQLGDVAFRLDVGVLPPDAVTQLADQMGAKDMADSLIVRTRGHTLFVVETLRGMADAGRGLEEAPPPESLVDAVLARVSRAGAGVEEFLRSSAILGSAFDLETASTLADLSMGEAARRADRACRARLLVEAGPSFEFSNDLIREILYRTTPLATRTAGHARAADLLEENPEAVATHAAAAGRWRRAVEAWFRAAERAADRFSNQDAELMLDRALEAARRAGDPASEARARLERGRIREVSADFAGAYEDLWAAIERARAAGDRRTEMLGLRWLGGDVMVGLGRTTADCVPYLEAALALAEELGDGPTQVDILSRLAILSANRLRFDQAYDRAGRAESLARQLGDDEVVAVALDGLKTAAAYSGDIVALERLLPELEGILRRRGDPWRYRLQWTVFESAFPYMARGEWARALRRIEEALALNRQTGFRTYRVVMLAHAGWIHRSLGQYGAALGFGRESVELADEIGHPWWIAFTEAMLGWTLTEVFSVDEAAAHLERGLAAADRDGSESYVLRCLGHVALAACLRGDAERALAASDRAEGLLSSSLAVPPGGVYVHGADAIVAMARARLLLGRPELAEAVLARVVADAEAAGWREPLADALLVLGLCRRAVGDDEHATRLLGRALEVAEAAALRRIEWEAHTALATVGLGLGRSGDGEAHASAARSIMDDLARSIDQTELRETYLQQVRIRLAAASGVSE